MLLPQQLLLLVYRWISQQQAGLAFRWARRRRAHLVAQSETSALTIQCLHSQSERYACKNTTQTISFQFIWVNSRVRRSILALPVNERERIGCVAVAQWASPSKRCIARIALAEHCQSCFGHFDAIPLNQIRQHRLPVASSSRRMADRVKETCHQVLPRRAHHPLHQAAAAA